MLTPEIRRQIRKLKRELDQYYNRVSVHQDLFSIILLALETARRTASCLLTQDPFEAWEEMTRRWEEEFDADFGIVTTERRDPKSSVKASNVTKLITLQMRAQQISAAKKRLDDYARCLGEFFRDVNTLASLNTALELAGAMQRNEPLETADAQQKQEEAEGEEDLGRAGSSGRNGCRYSD